MGRSVQKRQQEGKREKWKGQLQCFFALHANAIKISKCCSSFTIYSSKLEWSFSVIEVHVYILLLFRLHFLNVRVVNITIMKKWEEDFWQYLLFNYPEKSLKSRSDWFRYSYGLSVIWFKTEEVINFMFYWFVCSSQITRSIHKSLSVVIWTKLLHLFFST